MSSLRILVTDEIDPDGVDLLRSEPSFVVDEIPTPKPAELLEKIGGYDAFVGRSATRLPAEVLKRATKLRVIGRAGVGTDNIDIPAATHLGIAIINAPGGNTVAVAELFFGALIGLVRHLPRAATSMREGKWDRSQLLGTELRGRSLGIVGLGRIGGEVALRARAFGMMLTAYDPYVTDERFDMLRVMRANSLEDLLKTCDIITVHTPLNPETAGMIGAAQLKLLKRGSIVANLARGGIVEERALAEALGDGSLGGAILDVYSHEPLDPASPLRSLPNVVLTPHLGASTAEGQHNVAVDVCAAVRDALLNGELSRAINVVGGIEGRWDEIRPALVLTRRMASIGRAILADRGARAVDSISLKLGRDLSEAGNLLVASAAAGALDSIIDGVRLNLVNARALAETRGIALSVSTTHSNDPDNGAQVTVHCGRSEVTVAGVAPAGSGPRLTRIDGFTVDVTPRRTLLVLTNADVPGVIGRVGTLLGGAHVNIAEYHQARLSQGGQALAAVSVDGEITEGVRQLLLGLPDIRSATVIDFSKLDAAGEEVWT
ncbi:MAG TPA: phosphoglycerate dehydrogenase [Gemmatimonadaceae bacterium]|nr:phosphoglycerate dehydrogenase [Gemmatimonadaceae bacterium]